MLETREQSARLVGPFSGDINITSNTPISIRFNGSDLKKEDLFIKISGENAIIRGQEAKGYEIMELLEKERYLYIKFRKLGDFKAGEIFVFGKCKNCFTREQRFFIAGSKTTLNKESKMYHEYQDINSSWIHADSGKNSTIHKHKKIKEGHVYEFFTMTIKEAAGQDWNKIFISDDSHVWWNNTGIITRSDVDIFRMRSDDILWKPEDVGLDEFRTIRPIGKYSIIVNDKKRINYSVVEVLDI